MEHIFGKQEGYIGVMLTHFDFSVVVSRKNEGDKTVTYVSCPFPALKFGFVDTLDKFLKDRGTDGVLKYEVDDELSILKVDDKGADMRKIVYAVDSALMKSAYTNLGKATDCLKRKMRQYLLATHQHWMTLEKYMLLNSIIDEQD